MIHVTSWSQIKNDEEFNLDKFKEPFCSSEQTNLNIQIFGQNQKNLTKLGMCYLFRAQQEMAIILQCLCLTDIRKYFHSPVKTLC